MLLILLALITTSPTPAKSTLPAKKSQLLDQLHQTCLKNSFTEGKSQDAACDCLRANYEKKLSEDELAMLIRIHAGTVTKEELAGQDELFEFDMYASQQCLENSAWRWVPVAKPKEELKADETETQDLHAEKKLVKKEKANPKKSPPPKPLYKKKRIT